MLNKESSIVHCPGASIGLVLPLLRPRLLLLLPFLPRHRDPLQLGLVRPPGLPQLRGLLALLRPVGADAGQLQPGRGSLEGERQRGLLLPGQREG